MVIYPECGVAQVIISITYTSTTLTAITNLGYSISKAFPDLIAEHTAESSLSI